MGEIGFKEKLQKREEFQATGDDIPEFRWDELIPDIFIPLTKANLSQIEVGMIWYEDDTCSFDWLPIKSMKAIIECIDENKIYGDLTISDCFKITEHEFDWDDAKRYFENFSYPCKENEKIVWYSKKLLEKVANNYHVVSITFDFLWRKAREGFYWSSTELNSTAAWVKDFSNGSRDTYSKDNNFCVRPVLEFEL